MSTPIHNVQAGQGWWQPLAQKCDVNATEMWIRLYERVHGRFRIAQTGHGWWQPPVVRCDGDVTQVWRVHGER